jgi:secondary thiamine-phosphate synthase enzyme
MLQSVTELSVATPGRCLCEITTHIERCVRTSQIQTGLCTIHLRHTSASLLIQENADPDVRQDLEAFFSRLVPDGDPLFVHTSEGDDDMPAHIRTALTQVNLSIPILGGRLVLGTWQGIYLWEHRKEPHHRRFVVHLIGEKESKP